MEMERIIERTDDGSATLFVPELNEHYHSVKGARTESQHIFIDMAFHASDATSPKILEVGFGTGLNALLTLAAAEKSGRKVHYTGIELYPLQWETVSQLGYTPTGNETGTAVAKEAMQFKTLHTSPWEKEIEITPYFTLRKVQADINQLSVYAYNDTPDLIYFDAFAPEKQPEMWTQELFNHLYVILKKDGILTTYCAKGIVRRMLQAAGFVIERLPGPPGGKREILRGRKQK